MELKEIQEKFDELGYYTMIDGDRLTAAVSTQESTVPGIKILVSPVWITIKDGYVLLNYYYYQINETKIFESSNEVVQFVTKELPKLLEK